ncbi:MauE/DoxX family redox-associated membrane protein [Sphingobacterium siyangense]|uniref:MauE/DoxX family redox-associated membrane protein n=3 Tax=Bacteroidota TaxID=976 RepID=UPI003DA638F0
MLTTKEMDKALKYQKRSKIAFKIIMLALLALWIPVAIDKLTDFETFKSGIYNQPFSDSLGNVLIYTLPVLECATIICLIYEGWRKVGLILSTMLMTAFTGYVGIALLGAWKKLPCGCGSVISGMSWERHFLFNLFFLFLSLSGLYLWRKLRSGDAGSEAAKGGSAKRHIKQYSLTSKF